MTRKNCELRLWLATFCGLVATMAATAADYNLDAGESDTISSNAEYDAMTIGGSLTVNGNAVVKFTSAEIKGGTVTVDGAKSSFGSRTKSSALTLSHDATGNYGQIVLKNGTANGFTDPYKSDNTTYNLGTVTCTITTNDAGVVGNNGIFDFLRLDNASGHFRPLENNTSLTGRITVVGSSGMTRSWGYSSGNGLFETGDFIVDLKNDALLTFNFGNQQASLSSPATKNILGSAPSTVRFTGTGDVKLLQSFNGGTSGYFPIFIRPGTRFDNDGELILSGGVIQFAGDDPIGPNVKCLRVSAADVTTVITHDKTINLAGDLAMASTSPLIGFGTLNLDCSAAPRQFTANAPQFRTLKWSNANNVITNQVRVIKTGANEATFVSTNLVKLWVKEGVARFVQEDCTIQKLVVNEGAEVVADGCTITLTASQYKRPIVRTVNGGRVVFAGDEVKINGGSVQGNVHVRSGEVSFRGLGRSEKYWRFTFKGAVKPSPLIIVNLYLFDADHHLQMLNANSTMAYTYLDPITDDNWTDMAEKTVRWRYNSATNLTASTTSWQCIRNLDHIGTTYYNSNNCAWMYTPVINRNDPTSYLTVELRVADNTPPITGYNLLLYGTASSAYADTWDVYCSADGQTWTQVDAQEGLRPIPLLMPGLAYNTVWSRNDYQTFDGYRYNDSASGDCVQYKSVSVNENRLGELFYLPGTATSGLSSGAPVAIQVDPDATIDFTAYTATPQTIDELTVDFATGGGTIKGGVLAAKGEVKIENLDWDDQQPVSFTFDGTTGLDNLQNWTVTLNGVPLSGYVTYDSENKKLTFNGWLVRITSNVTNGDLQGTYLSRGAVNLKFDSGVVYTNTTALSGENGLKIFGDGRMVLTQESPNYTGAMAIEGGIVEGVISHAFGRGEVAIGGSTTGNCMVILGASDRASAYDNSFVLLGDSSDSHPAIKFLTKPLKRIDVNGSVTAYGLLAMDDSRYNLGQGVQLVSFNGAVNCDGQIISYSSDSSVNWNGRIAAAELRAITRGYPSMGTHFLFSEENCIGRLSFHYISCIAKSENAFGGALLRQLNNNTEYLRGMFGVDGCNQTIAGLGYDDTALSANVQKRIYNASSTAPVTLTLTGGVSLAKTRATIANDGMAISLTIAAGNDDFVQELTNSLSTTRGNIIISNGCLRLTGSTTMTNVPSIAVEGGALEILSTNDAPFASVTGLTVAASARLSVAAIASDPFGDAESSCVKLALASDATLEIEEGATLTVQRATLNGAVLAKGVYTGDSEDNDHTYLPQISGNGQLIVTKGVGMVILLY